MLKQNKKWYFKKSCNFLLFKIFEQKNLVIECGLETRYLFGKMSVEQIQEAKLFEINKKKCNGYHFIAVQSNSDGEEIDGFWLLKS